MEMRKNFVEDAQAISPQFMLPDLRIGRLFLSIDTTEVQEEEEHTVKGPLSLKQKFQETHLPDTSYYCLLHLVLRIFFFLLHKQQYC